MEKILIVGDDAAIAASLARFLTSEGFAVQTVPDQVLGITVPIDFHDPSPRF